MAATEDGQNGAGNGGNGTWLTEKLKEDSTTKPSDQHPSTKLKHAIEAFTLENSTCRMNNGAQCLMTAWGTVLVAIGTNTESQMYVAALIFSFITWAVTVIMIIMIVIRRRMSAGKVLRLINEEWPEEAMEKTKTLQRFSFRLSMVLVFLHIISMVVTSVHISGVVEGEPRRADVTMNSYTADETFANNTSDS